MRSTSSRGWITLLAIATAFAVGTGVGTLTHREAQAQSPSTATLYVPAGGLVFRATDGTPLARLSRDAHGGTFEIFDDRHEVSMRVPRAVTNAPVPPANPYAIDRDPWMTSQPANKDDVF